MKKKVIVIGGGIVGISAAIWIRRAGQDVTLIDRAPPGSGASSGNAGVLAACSVAPVTAPGLLAKIPGMLIDSEFPLFLRWQYLPKMAPWLLRYLQHANEGDTRRISGGLACITFDSIAQHKALIAGTTAEKWMRDSDYVFAYADRAALEGDNFTWQLRREAGFVPEILEGGEVRDYEPALGPSISCLAVMKDHGFVIDPAGYVAALARVLETEGGQIINATADDFELGVDGRVNAVMTSAGRLECEAAVVATGVWAKPLMKKLELKVPLESERGYHVDFGEASVMPRSPIMVASGKFVATPMAGRLRCAGVVEFGGTVAGPAKAPLALLRRKVAEVFPGIEATGTEEWLGHRPAPPDSLPLIGEVRNTRVYAAFGHHHIGLTAGPKTGRVLAGMISSRSVEIDPGPFDPHRFS